MAISNRINFRGGQNIAPIPNGCNFLDTDIADWAIIGAGNPTVTIDRNVRMVSKNAVTENPGISYTKKFHVESGMRFYWNITTDVPSAGWGSVGAKISNDNGVTWTELTGINSVNNVSGNVAVNVIGDCLFKLEGYSGTGTITATALVIQ